jgi:metallo-beta-lactamase family protein
VDESKALNERSDPMIIISASGMIEAGRILHHLRNNIHDSNSTLLIVSWQAPHTLGRRLLEGNKQVKIFGEPHDVRIEVQRVKGFSAHGGQDMLRDYALTLGDQLKGVFLVHGEQDGADGLTETLTNWNFKKERIHFPARGESFDPAN